MKVLIISDSHGRDINLKRVINKIKPIDLLIHLGDFEGSFDYISKIAGCPVEAVSGNNDFFSNIDKEKIIKVGKYKVFLSHGHRFGVSYSLDRIKNIGKQYGANIIMFGHTHIPYINITEDIWTINPGSISLPRQGDGLPSYIIMDINDKGEAHFTLKKLSKHRKVLI